MRGGRTRVVSDVNWGLTALQAPTGGRSPVCPLGEKRSPAACLQRPEPEPRLGIRESGSRVPIAEQHAVALKVIVTARPL